MKTIGFSGGGLITELGSIEDVQMFFDLINYYVVKKYPNKNWPIIMDRLYKRYIKSDELDMSVELMECVKNEFKNIKSTPKHNKENFDYSKNTLFDIFENYFKNFSQCAEMTKLSFEEFKNIPDYKYEPIKIVITDQPWYLFETTRTLEDYDNLNGTPFLKLL